MTESGKTVAEVLRAGTGYLAGRRIEHPDLVCRLLLARLLGCRHLEVQFHAQEALPEPRLEAMRRGIRRVAAGEPVQYVLGQTEFMGHVFKVDRRGLIPRPETEELVARVLAWEPLWKLPQPMVVDVGTGSGCIAISLALAQPRGLYAAFDPSAEALALARENAALHKLEGSILFLSGDLGDAADPGTVDAVVSNPPYIPSAECDRLPAHIRDHEPRGALDGGPSGLAVVEQTVEAASFLLKPGGWLFMEIGHDQAARARALLEGYGFAGVQVHADLAGHPRIVQATLPADGA